VVSLIFIWHFLFFTIVDGVTESHVLVSVQKQDFESDFEAANFPDPFLTNWYGNEVRSTNSRVFQSNSEGRSGSKALAVQPTSSYNGELTVRLIPSETSNPKVRFWAKSRKNGSGNRSAEVYYSWSTAIDSEYSEAVILGRADEFTNEDQDYMLFEASMPQELAGAPQVFFKLEIRYGSGKGSCARWFMDDFEFGEFVEDTTPPTLISVRGFDEGIVQVQFSESVDAVFSEFLINYKIGGIDPGDAELVSDSLVNLTFKKLEVGGLYELEVIQIPDVAGNFLRDTLVAFQYTDPTSIPPKTIVINELMPAPRGDLDLPNAEYVELFHAGDYPVRLQNLTFSNSRTSVTLPDVWFEPEKFLILTSTGSAEALKQYGDIIPLKNWPTLLNAADQIILKDDQGAIIDQLGYSTSSWDGSEFANGGYSLEVVNPYFACDQSEFILSSKDTDRGTPGRENSVFDLIPDSDPPVLLRSGFASPREILLEFNEPILPELSTYNFGFEPNLTFDTIQVVNTRTITIMVKEEVAVNSVVNLTLREISDCAGNIFSTTTPVELILPTIAQKENLLLNEILFNPKSGSPKFVEVINTTDSHLEIGEWNFAHLDQQGLPDQAKRFSNGSLILPPKGILAFSTSPDQLKFDFPKSSSGNIIMIESFPSYPIAEGTVVLLDAEGLIAETFNYFEDLHHPLLRNPKGVSLERLSIDSEASVEANWHSASSSADFGTPGLGNSQLLSGEFENEIILIEPAVFDPEGTNGNTFTTIRYQLDQPGWTGSFKVYALDGTIMQVLAQNQLLGASGHFTWTGTDSGGKAVRSGYYILTVELYDLSGEVKIFKKSLVIATKL